ncbi:MAG: DNA-formamidopyrimidine glycosylase family protein [Sulfobacillus sp.]
MNQFWHYIDVLMPEAPEVAVMTDFLSQVLLDRNLLSINSLTGRFRSHIARGDPDGFLHELPLRAQSIGRLGKFSWICFEKDWSIWVTYGMSGSLKLRQTKHSHLCLETDGEVRQIFYENVNLREGHLTFSRGGEELRLKLAEFGRDVLGPLPDDREFIARARNFPGWNVCKLLLDQRALIAGVGNYIKSESLYRAHISPFAQVRSLTDEQLLSLRDEAWAIARESYEDKGTTRSTFSDAQGRKGEYFQRLAVYENRGTDRNGFRVRRVEINGRGTWYVPEVQTIGNALDPARPENGSVPLSAIKIRLKPKSKTDVVHGLKLKLKLIPKM